MSENKGTAGRARRRVVRSAGPPVEGGEAAQTVARAPAAAAVESDKASAADTAAPAPVDAAADTDAPTVKGAVADDSPTVKSTVSDGELGTKDDTAKTAGAVPLDAPVEDSEVAADQPDSADPSAKKAGSLGKLGWAAAVVAVLSALVLLGSGGFFLYHQNQVNTQDTRRADYAQTAKQAVLNLTNIKGDTAPQDIDRVLAVASGQLKAEYTERKDAYAQVVQQAQVKASGEIIETAVESDDDHSARVLVAAKQTLTNAASPDPQQRYYRFRVTVTRGDDGNLTASQAEFVA
ncbi:hypothetical protein [Nocardia mexicana]|uniref:Mce-associated membrane protein n=1 Tax=Nocardia mexicana TaxID=279262 RepID=A0A370GUA2_9NOCA|nr:hypothetical protein [Nocardia mexicana]RDI47268.1 Mce-associated membrane protein [Nocardia mexicana]